MADTTTTLARFRDSDMWWSFRRSPTTVAAAVVTVLFFMGAIFAPWVAPYNPFDVKALNLMDAFTPPAWTSGGSAAHLLGTVLVRMHVGETGHDDRPAGVDRSSILGLQRSRRSDLLDPAISQEQVPRLSRRVTGAVHDARIGDKERRRCRDRVGDGPANALHLSRSVPEVETIARDIEQRPVARSAQIQRRIVPQRLRCIQDRVTTNPGAHDPIGVHICQRAVVGPPDPGRIEREVAQLPTLAVERDDLGLTREENGEWVAHHRASRMTPGQ